MPWIVIILFIIVLMALTYLYLAMRSRKAVSHEEPLEMEDMDIPQRLSAVRKQNPGGIIVDLDEKKRI